MLDRISLLLTIVGGINWLLVGLFQFDLVAYIFGGQAATISRILYAVIGIAALWCISLLVRERTPVEGHEYTLRRLRPPFHPAWTAPGIRWNRGG